MRILCLNAWGGRLAHSPTGLKQPVDERMLQAMESGAISRRPDDSVKRTSAPEPSLTAFVAEEDPDVLCLQEVVHSPSTDRAWLEYRDGPHVLAQRANLFAEIRAVLPRHMATFCAAACGPLFDGETPVPSFWGLATFVRDTLPVIGQAQGFVHKGYAADGFGEHPRSRNAHAVRIHDGARGQAITVAHMHGLRDPAGKHDTPDRIAQAGRLRDLVDGLAEPGDGIVVCGDFNVEPSSATFAVLAEIGLADLVTARGFTDTRTSHYSKPGRFADYMLVNSAVDVKTFEVVEAPEVSDHRPLRLTLR